MISQWITSLALVGMQIMALPAIAADQEEVSVRKFMQDYVDAIASGHKTHFRFEDRFSLRMNTDANELKCAKAGCKVIWRQPLDKVISRDGSPTYYAFIDIQQADKSKIVRGGCYVIAKHGSDFVFETYIHDCDGH